ncbi:MAG: DNA-directed RNA polymerase subunit omega [Candidatus Omnitrophota bacterium]
MEKSGGSIYKLVVLASKRALDIADDQPKGVDKEVTVKPTTLAFQEIADGKIQFKKIK